MSKIKLSKIKPNPNNPRIIKDDKFKKLVQSLQEFPEMMEKRPMVCVTDVDGSIYPLGGNMRLKALQELKLKDIPSTYVMMADEWTEERRREFVIKDNVGFGEWDWQQLANDWDTEQLQDWGLDVPEFATEVDYSILDDEDVEDQLADMTNGVKKAIQIEFEAEHYEEAYALVKFWREQNAYVGGMIMEYLKEEKNKI
jgi:ParB-like chromosome segregation protein Spo0J